MYLSRYIQYLNLPSIPQHIIDSLILDVSQHHQHNNARQHGPYTWSDYCTEALDQWCKENISNEMYYGLQLMTSDVPVHQDFETQIKINYIIDPGGADVVTSFYDDRSNKLASYCIEPNRWHIFKANTHHGVSNITTTRISVTAKIF